MIGKLFLTLATLALLHGMNVLSDISHYSCCSIAAYSTYEREHNRGSQDLSLLELNSLADLSLLKALGKPEGSLPLDVSRLITLGKIQIIAWSRLCMRVFLRLFLGCLEHLWMLHRWKISLGQVRWRNGGWCFECWSTRWNTDLFLGQLTEWIHGWDSRTTSLAESFCLRVHMMMKYEVLSIDRPSYTRQMLRRYI
jgi:hypothetical protein